MKRYVKRYNMFIRINFLVGDKLVNSLEFWTVYLSLSKNFNMCAKYLDTSYVGGPYWAAYRSKGNFGIRCYCKLIILFNHCNFMYFVKVNQKRIENLRGSTCIPYIKGISEEIKSILTKVGVRVALKPVCTVANILRIPKTRQLEERTKAVVRKFECRTCSLIHTRIQCCNRHSIERLLDIDKQMSCHVCRQQLIVVVWPIFLWKLLDQRGHLRTRLPY